MPKPFLPVASLTFAASLYANFQPTWRPWTAQQYQPIYQTCAHGDTLWAAGTGGVKRSVDGVHWSGTGAGMESDIAEAVAHGTNRLLAGQGRNLYSSEDGGSHWSVRDSIPWGSFLGIIVRRDTLYAYHSLYGTSPPEGVFYSIDDGLTWKDIPADRMLDTDPVVFHGDMISFSGKALLRKVEVGWDTLQLLPDPIAQVSASDNFLIACGVGRICMASPDGRSDWSALKTGYVPTFPVYLTADSAFLAMQTGNAIYLSRNQGTDWELLAWNFFPSDEQRLKLGDGWLYATDLAHPWTHRYDIGKAKWDSVPLPGASLMGAFAAGSGLIAYGGPDSADALYLSTDHGAHFRTAGKLGMHPDRFSDMAIAHSRLYFLSGIQLGVSDDSGRTWKLSRTPDSYELGNLSILDSGVYFTDKAHQVWRSVYPCGCSHWDWVEFPTSIPWQFAFAGSGNRLYFSTANSSWIGEDLPEPTVAVGPIARPLPARMPASIFPVPAWRRPGADDGKWIDAKGALRIYRR